MRKNRVTVKRQHTEQINLNKQAFAILEPYWATVRVGYIREIPIEVKKEIERIYKEEIDPKFYANYFCSSCFFNACKRLIQFYNL